MIAKQWRLRLTYLAMSAFVAWHTVAIALAPVPARPSTVKSYRHLFEPYLQFFGLDNSWDFFSPVGKGNQLRYVVEDTAGRRHTFVPIEEFNWYLPTHRWFAKTYQQVMKSSDVYGDYFAKSFCRKHADLNPVSVTLLELEEEQDFKPQDHLHGMRPLYSRFVTVNTLKQVECRLESGRRPKRKGRLRPMDDNGQ